MIKIPIGFSSSFIRHIHPANSFEAFEASRLIDCDAIELHCGLGDLDKINEAMFDKFRFVSFHLPDWIDNEAALVKIDALQKRFNFDSLVVHPCGVKDWEMLHSYRHLPFSIENMDHKKPFGGKMDDMLKVFQHNGFSMTLDINHCYANDPSLQLARDMWREFKKRISHFHLSGFDIIHVPLCETKQTEFIEFLKDKEFPVIIESPCRDLKQAKEEFEYIKANLEK